MDVCSLLDINTNATCKEHIDMCCLKVDEMVHFSIPTTANVIKNTILSSMIKQSKPCIIFNIDTAPVRKA